MIRINPEEAQVGDYVTATYVDDIEEIKDIKHDAGFKSEPQAYINGYYWNYEDMIVIRVV